MSKRKSENWTLTDFHLLFIAFINKKLNKFMKKNQKNYDFHSSKFKLLLKMKLLVLLLSITVASFATENYAQKAKFTLNFDGIAIEQVFQEVEASSEFIFIYSEKVVDLKRKVDISVEDQEITYILDKLFEGTNNSYQIDDRQILILSKQEDTVKTKDTEKTISVNQQDKTISGKVIDNKGYPMPGVTILVKGTSLGVITDYDGLYSIKVPYDAKVISFSFIGMQTKDIEINGQSVIDVTLEEETVGLDEVVAIGYGTQKRSNVTGSISSVKSTDLANRSVANAASALQGKSSGVQVINTSGAPGQSSTIRIRGFSSNGNSDPLYIVDGLKVPNLDYLEAENIESMEILKDGASAAIYGAEAGNGVVLITTKSGSKGKGSIFYNMSYTVSSIANELDVLNADDYVQFLRETGVTQEDLDSYYFENPSSYVNNQLANTDWQDIMFTNGYTQRHNLGFQGGNDKGSLYLAIGYYDNDGILVGSQDSYKRITGQFNATYNIKEWLEVGINNSIEKSKLKQVSEGGVVAGSVTSQIYTMDPLTPVEYSDGLTGATDRIQRAVADGYSPLMNTENGNYYGSSYWSLSNPYALLLRDDVSTEKFNINGTAFANIKPFKDFVFTSRLGYRFGNVYDYSYNPEYWLRADEFSTSPTLSSQVTGSDYYQWENFVNYSFNVKKSEFSVNSGMSYIYSTAYYAGGETDQLTGETDNFRYLNYSSGAANDNVFGTQNENVQLAYFGRLSWSYENRYNVQVNFRADAYDSAYLDIDNAWGYFPSISGGWTITNEKFMENRNTNFLSSLKLRASYGKNGSISNLGGYMYAASLSPDENFYYSIAGTTYLPIHPSENLANPSLKWEESVQFDAGIDMRFLNNKLSVTVDYYNKDTEGMLIESTAPLVTGTKRVFQNVGLVNNYGFEFDVEWKQRINNDFSYDVRANLGTVSNKVTRFKGKGTRIEGDDVNGTGIFVTNFEEGFPVWYLLGYKTEGIDPTDGSPIFKDINDDGIINSDDRTNIGDGIPDFTYGTTITLNYRNFDFLVYGAGSYGSDIMYGGLAAQVSSLNRPQFMFDERWTESNTTASRPSAIFQQNKEYLASDAMVFDGSFFKIKQIQMGYKLSDQMLDKLGFTALRVYVSLDNFFTFTKYPGVDPETRWNSTYNMAIDGGGYPVPKSVMFGLNLTL